MIGLDTNVLVRLIVEDDPDQAQRAEDLIRAVRARGSRCYVSQIVLCELVWVLSQRYRRDRGKIADVLGMLLHAPAFRVQAEEQVRAALHEFRSGRADFADCLIGVVHEDAGCERTMTFDRAAARLERFAAL